MTDLTHSVAAGSAARGPLLSALPQQPTGAALAEAVGELDRALGGPRENGVVLTGLHGAAFPLLLAGWYRQTRRPALVVAPTREAALQIADDLSVWLDDEPVVYLPQQEVLAFDRKSPDPAMVGEFMVGLERITRPGGCLAVTSLYAARQRVIAPNRLAAAMVTIRVGDRIEMDVLCTRLADRGYRPAGLVTRTGDYARRGGLLDVFAPGGDPLRIEFFDDEIVSLRSFDVETQRSSGRHRDARLLPVSHLVLDDDVRLTCLARLEEEQLAGRLDPDEFSDLEARLEEALPNDGLESFLPWYGPTAAVADYLPEAAAVFWCDPVKLGVQADLLDGELPRLRETRLNRDPVLPAVDELIQPRDALAGRRLDHVLVASSWIRGDDSGHWLGGPPQTEVAFVTSRPDLKGGDLPRLRSELSRREGAGEAFLLLCDNEGQAARLADLLDDVDGAGEEIATQPLVAALSAGFIWPRLQLTVVTDHEFFARYQRAPARAQRRGGVVVKERASLQPGEYVVHLEYGISRYRGLRRIEVESNQRECLLLEYDGGDRVYVPVENIDQVERYSSDTDANPTLAKLGTATWQRITKRARKAIRAMAVELLDLYAARQALPGHATAADNELQRSLEASFVYEETPDQLAAIADSKRDMEEARPMDRLICGDVGFGKTEVAIRAAFKAVQDGRQVAILCPTTLLAGQHGETFAERFRDFPVSVETLSRFKSAKQQRQILAAARAGEVDILIGTHRLLGRDVQFKDLCLLIVDEEQRFGVRHKERIKELRRQIDVMTLSATPIPRTLYLALMGARDMSLIGTPPPDRLPIQTELCAFHEDILTEAILRELHRDGQVFFVHNRVQTIEAMARLIQKLLPNVRVAVAHGQMKEEHLEQVMQRFLAHEYDVLVATAIIESGLDMPRVNTIIIDRADRFGLAQLYQLRGRVGRGNHRAFAYLMTPPGERLTPEARRRLAALEEFQALGSGYHIAMRDLEIRGAGNLLGDQQHGHMEAIGFDLYCRLLDETVAELKGGSGVAPLEVKVDLKLAAYLPDDYVGDPQQKMDLYRRVARTRDARECDGLEDEFRDRYGPLPEPVANLIALQRIRLLAGGCGVAEVRAARKTVDLFFASGHEPSTTILRGLMESCPLRLQFKAVDQFVMRVETHRDEALSAASYMLNRLQS